MKRTAWLAVLSFVLSACGPEPMLAQGERVYRQPLEEGNTFACATCHALREPAEDGFRRPGHFLGDATRRTSWKNGGAGSLLEAVNSCVTDWMGAPRWTESEPRFVALSAFLESQASVSTAPPVHYEIVSPPADVTGGDATRGRTLFNQSCAICHGSDGVGSPRGPNLAGAKLAPELIARRVRTSGSPASPFYPGLTGGRMPFWAKDRLSDDELRDVVAFVNTSERKVNGTDAGDPVSLDGGAGAGCDRTHPRVGWYADLSTHFHGVRGRVTIDDDCTLTLRDFYYDGNGIDVRLYGGVGGDFSQGFPLGPQLFRPGQPYAGETLTARLPEGKTMSDLDGVSVWCVAARVSFGDGVFRSP